MQENERERRLHELAGKLLFRFERRGSRFSLYRDVDVPKPVRPHPRRGRGHTQYVETSRAARWLNRRNGERSLEARRTSQTKKLGHRPNVKFDGARR
jgi:hypothetical protein